MSATQPVTMSITLSMTELALITASGIAAGFLNAVSGGGAMLTLPVLIFIGVPPAVANGTNRLAVVFQSLTALAAYRKLDNTDSKLALFLAFPAGLGSVCGSWVSVRLEDSTFQTMLAWMMMALIFPVLFEAQLHRRLVRYHDTARGKKLLQTVFFCIGLYGGLLQIGAGIFILVALSTLGGLGLVLANGVKVVIVLCLTSIALFLFILEGKIDWQIGILLSLSTSVGAWIGAHLGVSKGQTWIRRVVATTIVLMALQLLGGFERLAAYSQPYIENLSLS